MFCVGPVLAQSAVGHQEGAYSLTKSGYFGLLQGRSLHSTVRNHGASGQTKENQTKENKEKVVMCFGAGWSRLKAKLCGVKSRLQSRPKVPFPWKLQS